MTLIFITPCPKSTYSHMYVRVCVCVCVMLSKELRDPTTRKTLLHYSSINLVACLKPQRVFGEAPERNRESIHEFKSWKRLLFVHYACWRSNTNSGCVRTSHFNYCERDPQKNLMMRLDLKC